MARVLLNISSGFRPSSGHVLLHVNSLTSVVLGLVVARVLLNACPAVVSGLVVASFTEYLQWTQAL